MGPVLLVPRGKSRERHSCRYGWVSSSVGSFHCLSFPAVERAEVPVHAEGQQGRSQSLCPVSAHASPDPLKLGTFLVFTRTSPGLRIRSGSLGPPAYEFPTRVSLKGSFMCCVYCAPGVPWCGGASQAVSNQGSPISRYRVPRGHRLQSLEPLAVPSSRVQGT